ncbi:MAG TPA: (Fe-S)-binding protein, partial [Planctomycetes bacterium]|nr:(Fe-S)-binding protein [Planctomycetota bacterium]
LGIGAARGLADLPAIEPRSARSLLPERIPAVGPSTREVYLLQGCVQADLLPEVDRSTATALAALGVHVRVPALPCCGSLHAHNGDRVGARRLAQGVIEVFEADDLPIVLNSAGCGAHLAELHHLFPPSDPWHARARAIAERVVDFSVFVAPLLADRELSIAPSLSPITWDDPCHLCHGQGVREEPRAVLQAISNAEFVPLSDPEACCGSAGIYSILRPDDAREVFEPKLASFRASGARTLVTSNPGCQLQWTSGLRRAGVADARVISLSELVAHALAEASAKPLSSGHDETHD